MIAYAVVQKPSELSMADRLARIAVLASEAIQAMDRLLVAETDNAQVVAIEETDQALGELVGLIAGEQDKEHFAELIEFVRACYGGHP